MRVQALPRSMVRRQQRASVLSFVIAASTLWAGPSAALQPAEGLHVRVPAGYAQLADSKNVREQLRRTRGPAAGDHHTTVLYTMDGGVYYKRDSSSVGRGLPRSLLDIERARGYQSSASANPNPDLQCQGCPTTDTRARVTNTTEDPWTAIGLLAREEQMALSAEIAQCTGTLIGSLRQHVLTAGHCLVDNSAGGSTYDKITYYPAISGSILPFGTLNAKMVRVLQQYIDEQSVTPLALNYDFGLITLASPAPNGTTTINIAAGEGSSVKYTLQTAGYPADKKPAQTMWQVDCPAVTFNFDGSVVPGCGSSCNNIAVHDCLSSAGQSGSAIWSGSGSNRTIRAVLTGALTMSDGTTLNTATELNAFVYNTIAGWYNDDITNGLPLAPPASTSTDTSPDSSSDFFYNSNGWFHDHWWVVLIPIVVIVLIISLVGGALARSRRIKAASGVNPAAYAGQTAYPVQPGTNYANYGPAYYNGFGSTGYGGTTMPAGAPPNGYPPQYNPAGSYPPGAYAPSNPYQAGQPYQAAQYPTSYPTH